MYFDKSEKLLTIFSVGVQKALKTWLNSHLILKRSVNEI